MRNILILYNPKKNAGNCIRHLKSSDSTPQNRMWRCDHYYLLIKTPIFTIIFLKLPFYPQLASGRTVIFQLSDLKGFYGILSDLDTSGIAIKSNNGSCIVSA
jgi:hypothetical protein